MKDSRATISSIDRTINKTGLLPAWDLGMSRLYHSAAHNRNEKQPVPFFFYVASYLMRRYGLLGLREIGLRVGLHFSVVGNAVQQVTENPTRT
jgi:hypothetical protein